MQCCVEKSNSLVRLFDFPKCGSSGNLMGSSGGLKVEFSAVEEDARPAVAEGSESSGLRFDGLSAAVATFTHGVGDAFAEVRQDVLHVPLQHLGHLDDGFESAPSRPVIPATEELPRICRIAIVAEPAKLLLDGPGPRGLSRLAFQRFKLNPTIPTHVFRVEQPQWFASRESFLAGSLERFCAPDDEPCRPLR